MVERRVMNGTEPRDHRGVNPISRNEPAEGALRLIGKHAVALARPEDGGEATRAREYTREALPIIPIMGEAAGYLRHRSNEHRLSRRECRCRLLMLTRSRRS